MLQDISFLWAVTAIVWLGTAIYVVTLLRRQKRLNGELARLEQTVQEIQNRARRMDP